MNSWSHQDRVKGGLACQRHARLTQQAIDELSLSGNSFPSIDEIHDKITPMLSRAATVESVAYIVTHLPSACQDDSHVINVRNHFRALVRDSDRKHSDTRDKCRN